MTTSLADLISQMTKAQLREMIRSGLQGQGLPTSDWTPAAQGGIENGAIDMVAGTLADLEGAKLAEAIRGGHLGLAAGDWMTFLAGSYYLNERNPATATVQAITLTCVVTAGPYVIVVDDLVVSGASGNKYRNIEAGVLQPGASIVLRFQAEAPGASYNDAAETLTTLVTSLPGVTVVNKKIFTPNPAALVAGSASKGLLYVQEIPQPSIGDASASAQSSTSIGQAFSQSFAVSKDRFRVRITKTGKVGTAKFSISVDDGRTWSEQAIAVGLVDTQYGVRLLFTDNPATSSSFVDGDIFFFAATPIVQQGSDAETDPRLAGRSRARWLTLSDVPSPGTVELWAKTASPEVARVKVLADTNAANRVLVYIGSSAGRAAPDTVVAVQQYVSDRLDPDEGATVQSVAIYEVVVTGSVKVPRLLIAQAQQDAERLWTTYLASVDIGGAVRLSELQQALKDAGAIDYDNLVITGGSPNVVIAQDQVASPKDGTTLLTALIWEAI